jgi:hypothetical protein
MISKEQGPPDSRVPWAWGVQVALLLGFEQIGIRRGYHHAPDGREDAIVLKLNLRQA